MLTSCFCSWFPVRVIPEFEASSTYSIEAAVPVMAHERKS